MGWRLAPLLNAEVVVAAAAAVAAVAVVVHVRNLYPPVPWQLGLFGTVRLKWSSAWQPWQHEVENEAPPSVLMVSVL